MLVAVICAAAPSVAVGSSWVAVLAPLIVGVFGFVFSWRADARADEQEARAERAESRAEGAERRALDAEKREQEAHGWDRERREAEQARARAQRRVEEWVAEKKRAHGTAHFMVPLAELDLARAAEAAGFLDLRELQDGDGTVVDAMACVSGALIEVE